jgi:hypothetical protein
VGLFFPGAIQPGLALAYVFVGEPDQAIAYADRAKRLSPHGPTSIWPSNLANALAFSMLQDYEEAPV